MMFLAILAGVMLVLLIIGAWDAIFPAAYTCPKEHLTRCLALPSHEKAAK
jgi:hypothetical protein